MNNSEYKLLKHRKQKLWPHSYNIILHILRPQIDFCSTI